MIFVVASAVVLGDAATSSQAGELYRCHAHELRSLDQQGRFGHQESDANLQALLGDFIVDTDTGTIRTGTYVQHWRVVQNGSAGMDFVAVQGISEAEYVTDYLRVRAWKDQPQVTFFRVALTSVMTGLCTALR